MTEEMSQFEVMRLQVKGAPTLESAATYLKDTFKVVDLEAFAVEAGVESPAKTKDALIDQVIAAVTSGEEANVQDDSPGSETAQESVSGDDPGDVPAPPDAPTEDEASSDGGVLREEGRVPGVSLPAKVAKYRPEQLWPQISGWEIDQGLDDAARATFSEDECREYLAYLWKVAALGQPPKDWLKITEYEFQGIRRDDESE